jgi:RNA polymerase sigma-70 factor (ECF subfamily)
MRSDAELILGAHKDPDLFRLLYDRYSARLHRFFWRRTDNREVALDLTAETFAQAWLARKRFQDLAGGNAGPWLFTIARRLLIASVEKQTLETRALDELQVEMRPNSDELRPHQGWLDGLDADLQEVLAELPSQQRQAVELRIVRELPYAAIGRHLGCSPTAARIRVSRGLRRLRARMEMD